MSAAEIAVRLLAGLVFMLTGDAILLPALGDRRGLIGVAVLLIGGTASFAVAIRWPRDGDQ